MDDFRKNLLVLASAGSGKTFCLSDRIIALAAMGVDPEKIVALT
ncbi:MAG: UvrD-helicase domain-containing protein, partial [bacterium]